MSNYATNKNISIPVEVERINENNKIYTDAYTSAKACFYSILYGINCDDYKDYPLEINSKVAKTINILEKAKSKIVDAICFIDKYYVEADIEDLYNIAYAYDCIEHIQQKLVSICPSPIENASLSGTEVNL